MSTSNPTVPPLAGEPHPRGEALEPVCAYLLDVVEELHGMAGTQWAAEPYTLEEREVTALAVRAVVQMMMTYGRTRDPFVHGDHEPA